MTFNPPCAVRFAPLPMVKAPLLDVTAPVTEPLPFQLPPVTPSVPAIAPEDLLMMPPPVSVALPLTVPLPVSVPAVPMETVLADAVDPSSCSVPVLIVVVPL